MSIKISGIVDDKSSFCIPFILDRIATHQRYYDTPFFLGLNGIQGAGKTTLVSTLHTTLTLPPNSLPTAILSIDDLYLPYHLQTRLAASHPLNPLIQHRGQPSTHDLSLGLALFSALRSRQSNIKIPSYDKSAHNGQGDRADESEWRTVNREGEAKVEVVILEGWCVGFRAMPGKELERRWREAKKKEEEESGLGAGRLWKERLEDLEFVNEALRGYDGLTDSLDAFIHIDAEDTRFVYQWRLEQEEALRASKGVGMTDQQVVKFVNGYYPAYELFTDKLRSGIFEDDKGRQLRLVVGKDRKVKFSEIL